MNTRILVITILSTILAGCGAVASQGDDVVRLIGDDVARIASQKGDDLARTAQQYADNIPQQTQYSDEAARYWDEIILSSQSVDDSARTLLYRSERLSPLQQDLVFALRNEASLSEAESLLYLQTVCSVVDYVELFAELPSTTYAELYAEQVAEQNGIPISSIQDFAESVIDFSDALIEGDTASARQESASIVFQGLCLVTSSE